MEIDPIHPLQDHLDIDTWNLNKYIKAYLQFHKKDETQRIEPPSASTKLLSQIKPFGADTYGRSDKI